MRTSPRFRSLRSLMFGLALFAGSSLAAHAHPGHDGHELTWDFGHLAAHPWATAFWVALTIASVCASAHLWRSRPGARLDRE